MICNRTSRAQRFCNSELSNIVIHMGLELNDIVIHMRNVLHQDYPYLYCMLRTAEMILLDFQQEDATFYLLYMKVMEQAPQWKRSVWVAMKMPGPQVGHVLRVRVTLPESSTL